MKIRVKTFAQIKDILGADSFLECQDGISMRELLNALRERAGKVREVERDQRNIKKTHYDCKSLVKSLLIRRLLKRLGKKEDGGNFDNFLFPNLLINKFPTPRFDHLFVYQFTGLFA